MKNLNNNTEQGEYYRIMEKRIKYYAEKYDPHTIVYDHQPSPVSIETKNGDPKKHGIAFFRSVFMNFF